MVLRHDCLGVLRAVAGDVLHRLLHTVHDAHGQDEIQELRAPVGVAGRLHARRKLHGPRAAPDLHAGLLIALDERREERRRDFLVHEECLHGVASAGALHLGIEADGLCHGRVGCVVHVGVADALVVLDHRDGGLLHDELHEAFAAARDDEVDQLVLFEQQGGGPPVLVVDECDGPGRDADLLAGLAQHFHDRGVGLDGLRASSEHHCVSGFEAQRGGIGGDVGAGLVDDADDTDRHAHPTHLHPVGAPPHFRHFTDGVGECRHLTQAHGHLLDALGVQREPIQRGLRESARGDKVLLVCRQQLLFARFQGVGHGQQGLVLHGRGQRRQLPRRSLGL